MEMTYNPMDPFNTKGAGWGYWKINPTYVGDDFRFNQPRFDPEEIDDFKSTYLLNGCTPGTMFKPGTEPKRFKFFYQDHTMMPWLNYPSASNKIAHCFWAKLIYRTWSMTENSPVDKFHRERVNSKLKRESKGIINDISDLWGGIKPTKTPKRKKALVVPSSTKNHKHFYNETPEQWAAKIIKELERQGYDYSIRYNKIHPNNTKIHLSTRINSQVPRQLVREGCDLLIGQHTAANSEVVVLGIPVVTTSVHNPARDVSTHWEDFCKGELRTFSEKEIDDWLTRICAYTYYRDEINTLKFIDYHPDAFELKKARYKRASSKRSV